MIDYKETYTTEDKENVYNKRQRKQKTGKRKTDETYQQKMEEQKRKHIQQENYVQCIIYH